MTMTGKLYPSSSILIPCVYLCNNEFLLYDYMTSQYGGLLEGTINRHDPLITLAHAQERFDVSRVLNMLYNSSFIVFLEHFLMEKSFLFPFIKQLVVG